MASQDEQQEQQPVYFWRETDPQTGWLSQWYYCPFRDDEDPSVVYDTADYMMYHKALLFGDRRVAAQVLAQGLHPRKVKALGRKVAGFDEATWTARRGEIVRRGNVLKFTRAVTEEGFRKGTTAAGKTLRKTRAGTRLGDDDGLPPLIEGSLREMLLATGEREIVEASPYDSIWGIGFTERDAEGMREHWGENLLGKALMEVRSELRESA
ncbi:hypothetical protein VFPBJ_03948 [Purpureocillium lilacinum]|uniref:NADAR domain-containing protein n=1 Tax=Purpureocillium lilacinum TaxID=33203 RepID=A0A179GTY7_PURLI|nr:hypothetical protein VFPBJ_03948 [Purpureocillium lilacinum]